uniref:COL8A n=1 Tax=Rhabditophanes sp. KR3021 TaxID=114890 RepID=A0AC35U2B1_9BILA
MPMYRLGSVHTQPDNITAWGLFIHYVPSTSEWVTGKSQFFTLAKNCFLEFYINEDGNNVDSIKVDNLNLSQYNYTQHNMNYFGSTFGHYIMPLNGYGVHSFENSGKYVLYVVCKHVNKLYSSSGYTTGFNLKK